MMPIEGFNEGVRVTQTKKGAIDARTEHDDAQPCAMVIRGRGPASSPYFTFSDGLSSNSAEVSRLYDRDFLD
jgi:hypothetical protein